jgi:hypothetical protein
MATLAAAREKTGGNTSGRIRRGWRRRLILFPAAPAFTTRHPEASPSCTSTRTSTPDESPMQDGFSQSSGMRRALELPRGRAPFDPGRDANQLPVVETLHR